MKLLVIVLCLLSERYLIHALSLNRFNWFNDYCKLVFKQTDKMAFMSSPWLLLLAVILPIFLVSGLVLLTLHDMFFGFFGLILNIVILYYCLGPQNPFYPLVEKKGKKQASAASYLSDVNGQLFAVLFWYILTGPIGIIIYRTLSLACDIKPVSKQAQTATAIMDWIPARLTAILYMLVGNFQQGLSHLLSNFFAAPGVNDKMLQDCALASAASQDSEQVSLAVAENLVEHAVIVLLVFLALFTLIAWL